MNSTFRKIKTPDLTSFSNWPEPYHFMMHDLVKAMDANASYLVGLGLFCYSEIVGREIMKYSYPDKKKFDNKICFEKFVGEYMGYGDLIIKYPDIYDWFRHGFCHEYFIKMKLHGRSGVYHFYEDSDIDKFKNAGVDTSCGIVIAHSTKERTLVVEPYLRDFKNGIEKFLLETKQI